MIQVDYIGRMGNNMFQYALGRIIHEKTGRKLTHINQNKDLREKYKINISHGSHLGDNFEHFVNIHNHNERGIPGTEFGQPLVLNEYNFESVDEMIRMAGERGIIIHGFFQRWKYYIDWKEKIKHWFYLQPYERQSTRDWIFHIRHEDYLDANQQLPIGYYRAILESYSDKIDHVYFIGAKLTDEAKAEFGQLGQFVDKGSSIEDYRFMQSFQNIICSNSTFAWWAAWLSNAERIFLPQPQTGYWSAGSDQDLFIPGSNMELVKL